MLKLSPEQTEKLQAIADAMGEEDLSKVLDYCIQALVDEAAFETEESPEEIAEIRRRCEELDRGEGVPIDDWDEFLRESMKRGKALAESRRAEVSA